MEKLKMHTPDFTDENIAKLAELFPNCVTEAAGDDGELKRVVDFDLLRQELSNNLVEGARERYHLDWAGKREALLTANAPVAKTLRPVRAESVDFDTTENLYIEGDNLDALKLLQETYLGKVKMIYIDPPYNTGNDFVYNDDFAEDTDAYFERSMQKDEAGNRLVANQESNGRFHSDWLSMMYPRLKLARNLLRDDGVIFISIDDNEQANLKRLCDEVFGEDNFIASIIWEGANKNDAKQIGISHEYVIVYAHTRVNVLSDWGIKKEGVEPVINEVKRLNKEYGNDFESASQDLASWFRSMKATPSFGLRRFRKIDEKGAYKEDDPTAPGGRRFNLKHPETAEVIPLRKNRGWSFDQTEFNRLVSDKRISFVSPTSIMVRRYLHETDKMTPQSVFYQPTRSSSERLAKLVGSDVFGFPKDELIIQKFIEMLSGSSDDNFIILDFFSGSATTAHAVMQVNAEDNGKRKFIMVQLDEKTDEKSEAFKAGYKTIAEIGKERIRRAGKKIKDSAGLYAENLDIGFRVLKVDTSNMKDVYYAPDQTAQSNLFDAVGNVKEDRTDEDLLFQVLLDWGVDLSAPIARETIAGKTVYLVDDNAIAACFDSGITENFVKQLAARKPLRAVFRDSGFESDNVKINVEQIFKLMSPSTDVKTI